MILERLVLENYKQFRERVELSPPEGAIGVVGSNGSGKTTIFESILWAFFGSRGGGARFANDSIPWSGGTTAEKTIVEVTLNISGAPYRVARTLHRGKTEAGVYSGDGEIVGGSSEVALWVQESLLGMDRVAFEATFFARQKELEFFAGVTGVERQREIARILGIDQVEEAQKLLRADRKGTRAEVTALESILEGVDHERLTRELGEARRERDLLGGEAYALRKKLEVAEKELSTAREEGERLEKDYRRHNELKGSLAAAESARERAVERAAELQETLRGLDKDERVVGELLPKVEELPRVATEIEALEEARRRQERREGAEREFKRRRMEAHRAVAEASKLLEDLAEDLDGARDKEPLPGWWALFDFADEVRRMREAEGALSLAGGLHDEAEDCLANLREVRARFEELEEDRRELEEAQEGCDAARGEVSRIEAALEELDGGIEDRLQRLRRRERILDRQAAQQKGLADADDRDADRLEGAARAIEAAEEDAECPTCHRPFAEDEHREVVETLLRQAGEVRGRAEEARDECRRLDEEAGELLGELSDVEKVHERVHALKEERTGAVARWETFEKALRRLSERVETLEGRLDGVVPVTGAVLEEAVQRAETLRSLRDAYPRAKGLAESYDGSSRAAQELEEEIEELAAGPAYDGRRHEALREERAGLERLRGRVESIQARLRGRPGIEERLGDARREEEEAAREAGRLRKELASLAFDEEAYLANREKVAEAEKARDGLREEREDLAERLRRVESRVEALEAEISRYEEQRKAADDKAKEVAKLGEMDGLFSEFYKELTARVRPVLEEEASELVRTLTDGRYEKVEFDQNYGVKLYDGLSDAYEISRFSGGEADIVSLAARVALSKMISSRGSEALGFIVLDEVFGALDAQRRHNVLLALDRLKRTFGQIFIISHVADVQESALLDELWMVEEDEEGKSTVRRVDVSSRAPAALPSGISRAS